MSDFLDRLVRRTTESGESVDEDERGRLEPRTEAMYARRDVPEDLAPTGERPQSDERRERRDISNPSPAEPQRDPEPATDRSSESAGAEMRREVRSNAERDEKMSRAEDGPEPTRKRRGHNTSPREVTPTGVDRKRDRGVDPGAGFDADDRSTQPSGDEPGESGDTARGEAIQPIRSRRRDLPERRAPERTGSRPDSISEPASDHEKSEAPTRAREEPSEENDVARETRSKPVPGEASHEAGRQTGWPAGEQTTGESTRTNEVELKTVETTVEQDGSPESDADQAAPSVDIRIGRLEIRASESSTNTVERSGGSARSGDAAGSTNMTSLSDYLSNREGE